MKGTVVQVSVSPGGVPKRAIERGHIRYRGLDGDSWAHPKFHGGVDQAVLLIAEEVLDSLRDAGFPVFPGALGENVTVRGIDPNDWRIGQVWRVGTASIELTKVRTPCATIKVYGAGIGKAIFDNRVKNGDFRSPLWGFSGMYARVVTEGAVQLGDVVELLSEQA